jgi:hypothetical protein
MDVGGVGSRRHFSLRDYLIMPVTRELVQARISVYNIVCCYKAEQFSSTRSCWLKVETSECKVAFDKYDCENVTSFVLEQRMNLPICVLYESSWLLDLEWVG